MLDLGYMNICIVFWIWRDIGVNFVCATDKKSRLRIPCVLNKEINVRTRNFSIFGWRRLIVHDYNRIFFYERPHFRKDLRKIIGVLEFVKFVRCFVGCHIPSFVMENVNIGWPSRTLCGHHSSSNAMKGNTLRKGKGQHKNKKANEKLGRLVHLPKRHCLWSINVNSKYPVVFDLDWSFVYSHCSVSNRKICSFTATMGHFQIKIATFSSL